MKMSSLYRSLVSNCAAALKEAILFHWRGLKLNVEESWSSSQQTWNVSTEKPSKDIYFVFVAVFKTLQTALIIFYTCNGCLFQSPNILRSYRNRQGSKVLCDYSSISFGQIQSTTSAQVLEVIFCNKPFVAKFQTNYRTHPRTHWST